jgi:uncharacterized protein YegP (UPF0339 family)
MAGKFEVYEDRAGKFRFRLKACNGQIVATGEAYETKTAAKKGRRCSGPLTARPSKRQPPHESPPRGASDPQAIFQRRSASVLNGFDLVNGFDLGRQCANVRGRPPRYAGVVTLFSPARVISGGSR